MLKNKETGKPHTAMWATIIGGLIAVACIVGVSFGKLPTEALATIVAPLIGALSMANRG